MIYTIKNPIQKEWNDKKFIEAYLADDKGEEFKVSAWNGEFQDENDQFKHTIDVELYKNEKGYWTISKPKKVAGATYMAAQGLEKAKAVEEIRNTNIKANMKDKEEGIAWFNSRNLAINFVEKYVSNPQTSGVDEALVAVRKYTDIFFKDWQNWSGQPF